MFLNTNKIRRLVRIPLAVYTFDPFGREKDFGRRPCVLISRYGESLSTRDCDRTFVRVSNRRYSVDSRLRKAPGQIGSWELGVHKGKRNQRYDL